MEDHDRDEQGADRGPSWDVAVVGGGTAGWLTALALVSCFPTASVTLVESPDVPTIGVGESTLPTMGRTLAGLGLAEHEWMAAVGATYKLGVRFIDWCRPGSVTSRADFWNPVEQIVDPAAVDDWFEQARSRDFAETCCATPPLLEQDLIPVDRSGERLAEYAFHVDAIALAGLLRSSATERGVVHRRDHVVAVIPGPHGIDSIVLEAAGVLRARLYVDCTGFRSVLLGDEQGLGEPWISYERALLTDSAVAIAAPHDDCRSSALATYTTARALSSGWMWKVPLADRFGAGYVYSSAHQSERDAEAELRRVLGSAADGAPARHLRAPTGRRRRSRVGNCVGVGLASGFVEPLEATGIYFVERAIATLVGCLQTGNFDTYDATMTASYEEVRDLIVMHYLINDREDTPFWRATKLVDVPVSLRRRLDEWRHRPPVAADFPPPAVFGVTTWTSVLAGMGFWREPIADRSAGDAPISPLLERERARLLAGSTDHRQLLATH